LEGLRNYFRQCHAQFAGMVQNGLFSDQIKNQRGFMEKVRQAVVQADAQLDFQRKTLAKAEETLRDCLREAQRIQTVIDRDRKNSLEKLARLEQKSMDEMANRSFFMGRDSAEQETADFFDEIQRELRD
jgi:flagellar export protein FliJ